MTMDSGSSAARKIMVVVDHNSSRESACALEYALSHAILEHDTLFILCVENPHAWKNPFGSFFKRTNGSPSFSSSMNVQQDHDHAVDQQVHQLDFTDAMRRACMKAHPKLKVVVEKVDMAEGKDKASVVLASSAAHMIDLLILGQRRSISNAILGAGSLLLPELPSSGLSSGRIFIQAMRKTTRKGGSVKGLDTTEYLIENSKCTCVAVQKKGQNGGYLLNSKKHKNFWLLA